MDGFRKDFVWGVAAASYQVEGGAFEDGKGWSIWDMYCRKPGVIANGDTGDIACDSYHRYREDIRLMKEIGVHAYRLSISWPRLLPSGTGKVNEKGLSYYDALIDELLQNGITPYITLFHWDYPYELYKRGGWLNPDSPQWFADYAKLVTERYSDRVTHFFTLNEPQCFIGLGFESGVHAPGQRLSADDTFQMAHNVLLGHGMAVMAMRAAAKQPLEIGYAPTASFMYPLTDSLEDIEAARRANFSLPDDPQSWTWNVSWWNDPVLLGEYPAEGLAKYEKYLPHIGQDDLKIISQPLDFLGQNIYNGVQVKAGETGEPIYLKRYTGFPKTALNWPITPECLYWGPRFLYERYHKPIYITENGLACNDVISVDGKVHDPNRIDFLYRYLRELKKASTDGVDVRGYFQWSIMDNFEWHSGYAERFGLVYVDYRDQTRLIKDSGYWYRDTIACNGTNLI